MSAPRRDPRRLSPVGRAAAWLATGPLGHLAAGILAWLGLALRIARARARGRDPFA